MLVCAKCISSNCQTPIYIYGKCEVCGKTINCTQVISPFKVEMTQVKKGKK